MTQDFQTHLCLVLILRDIIKNKFTTENSLSFLDATLKQDHNFFVFQCHKTLFSGMPKNGLHRSPNEDIKKLFLTVNNNCCGMTFGNI